MDRFLEMVAADLTRLGVEASSRWGSITVGGCTFHCREARRNYMLLGKIYHKKNDAQYNVNRAVMELIRRLPECMAEAEHQRQVQFKYEQARELTRRLGFPVTYDGVSFTLTYKTDTIEGIEDLAKMIEGQMASEWDEMLKQVSKAGNVVFTAEGGFSLN